MTINKKILIILVSLVIIRIAMAIALIYGFPEKGNYGGRYFYLGDEEEYFKSAESRKAQKYIEIIKVKLNGLKKDVANLVMDKNMKKLKDLKMISKKKKEIAQLLTLIKQKELLKSLESEVVKKEDKK